MTPTEEVRSTFMDKLRNTDSSPDVVEELEDGGMKMFLELYADLITEIPEFGGDHLRDPYFYLWKNAVAVRKLLIEDGVEGLLRDDPLYDRLHDSDVEGHSTIGDKNYLFFPSSNIEVSNNSTTKQ